MTHPRIGMTTIRFARNVPGGDWYVRPNTYDEAVTAAGGLPVSIPAFVPEKLLDDYLDMIDGMLFGRMAFADPDFANEILRDGRIDPKRVCLTCGKCGDLIRAHKPTGCVVRNYKTFGGFYQEFVEEKKGLPENFRG